MTLDAIVRKILREQGGARALNALRGSELIINGTKMGEYDISVDVTIIKGEESSSWDVYVPIVVDWSSNVHYNGTRELLNDTTD